VTIILAPSDITLGCGLFAFIGPNPQKYFSWSNFTILGLFNDTRGGDACGRVYNNTCEHGTGILATYKNFSIDIPNPTVELLSNTILGHCRKASSGGKETIYAQPIILRRKDINMKAVKDTHLKKAIKELPDDAIVFSGIHNGTISNYKELAPKYGIPIEDHNDSKVLLTALFYGNFSILSEYVGTAALIWQNHITKKSFIFRGASKFYKTSVSMSEERPLFYYVTEGDNFWISSMEDSLKCIGGNSKSIDAIGFNAVVIFKNGVKIKEVKIDRSNALQDKWDYNQSVKDTDAIRNNYYHSWSFEENRYSNTGKYKTEKKNRSQLDLPWHPLSKKDRNRLPEHVSAEEKRNPFIRYFDVLAEPFRLQAEKNDNYGNNTTRKAIFNKGRYWMNSGLMHGIYLLSKVGFVPSRANADAALLKPYYFVEGVLLDGLIGYNRAMELHGEFMAAVNADITRVCTAEQLFTKQVVKYSRYATVSLTGTAGEQDCWAANPGVIPILYTGKIKPLFSSKEYTFDSGDLENIYPTNEGIYSAKHTDDDAVSTNAYLKTCKDNPNKNDYYKIGSMLLSVDQMQNPFSPFQNLLLGLMDLKDEVDIQLTILHYLRDFNMNLRSKCAVCISKNSTLMATCTMCSDCKQELEELARNKVNYATIYD
jgi:hypothetical protein